MNFNFEISRVTVFFLFQYKVNYYPLGETTLLILFFLPSKWESSLREKCSPRRKSFHNTCGHPFEGILSPRPRKQTGRLENCQPLKKWQKNMLVYPFSSVKFKVPSVARKCCIVPQQDVVYPYV